MDVTSPKPERKADINTRGYTGVYRGKPRISRVVSENDRILMVPILIMIVSVRVSSEIRHMVVEEN